MNAAGSIPVPSDAVLIRLASIAANTEELLAADHQKQKEPVGLITIKNDRRRTMETILILLAHAEVRKYIAELESKGVLPLNR
jgi:hypothetical protein